MHAVKPSRLSNLGWIAGLLLWLAGPAAHATVPGGVAVVELPADAYDAWFEGRRVMIVPAVGETATPVAIVGIPLESRPGTLHVLVDAASGSYEQPFTVGHKDYPEQHITIENQRMVTPAAVDLERIRRESARMREESGRFSPVGENPFPLLTPVDGQISSQFGLKRFFNGEPRRPHSGLDIAAPEGTPILAPAAGTVTLTGDFYFNGNTVFMHHGGGLVSMGCHMSAIDVEEDDVVERGAQIGRVGATGRATGPHLHWSLYLNGERIDPAAALRLFVE